MDAAALLVGRVMHERLRPVRHRFAYATAQLRLDLARLDDVRGPWFGVDRWRPLSLRRRDYGPRDGGELLPWIRGLLRAQGLPADGAVWLQTYPRVLGLAFNPVSFWYCHDAAGALRAVLAEVNNTFGEHHAYLLCAAGDGAIDASQRLVCRKRLHVSPFCRVEGHYEFRCREAPGHASMAIDYHDGAGLLLRTAIGGRLQAFTPSRQLRLLLAYPLLALSVLGRIHWQAWRLWRRGVPWFRKPAPPAQSVSGAESIAAPIAASLAAPALIPAAAPAAEPEESAS